MSENPTFDEWDHVVKPRVEGAWNPHHCFTTLNFFALLSSATGIVGNRGQVPIPRRIHSMMLLQYTVPPVNCGQRALISELSMTWVIWMKQTLLDGLCIRLLRMI